MKTAFARIGSLVLFFVASSAMAGQVAVYIGKAINVTPAQAEAVAAVCALEYGKASGATVIDPTKAQRAVTPAASVVEVAEALNASELVELTLVSLATADQPGRLMVNAVRRDAQGREIFHADLTAGSFDDAAPVCQRLAEALTSKSDPVTLADRHNITSFEARTSNEPTRIGTEKVLGVRTGIAMALASSEMNPVGNIAFDARFEFDRFFLEVGAGILIPAVVNSSSSNYGGIGAEIGASYYLVDSDFAPYIGAGLQPRLIFGGSIFNLAPYAQVGLMLSRKASTRLYADFRVSQNVLPVAFNGTGGSLLPTELALQVGIGW